MKSEAGNVREGVAPVVLIVFNRPEQTRRVFLEIAKARPSKLFVIGDGARNDRTGEIELVEETRRIVSQVNWPCEVFYNYSEKNLGCKSRVSSGLSWVFTKVERAIILEDDCLPAPSFFTYCTILLEKYQNNRQIFSISGSNFSRSNDQPGHYFSNFSLMWGWATWSDRWDLYDPNPKDAPFVIRRMWATSLIRWLHWRTLPSTFSTTWDYQWIITLWRHNALSCRPTVNLVKNIGFGPGATHTVVTGVEVENLPVYLGDDDFGTPIGEIKADLQRDAIDERVWARISLISLLFMYFPLIYKLLRQIQRMTGTLRVPRSL